MTHHRVAGSVEAVTLDALHHLTDAEIEAATGKKRSAFYKAVNPTTPGGLHFADAARLDAALKAKGLPARFLPLFLEMSGGSQGQAMPDLEKGLRRIGCEAGDLFRAAEEANADGVLTTEERRAIAKEAQELMDASQAIRDAMEPPICGAAPLPLRRAAS